MRNLISEFHRFNQQHIKKESISAPETPFLEASSPSIVVSTTFDVRCWGCPDDVASGENIQSA